MQVKIFLIGFGSVLADYVTTEIGLKYPEIREAVPTRNPILEGATLFAGQFLILKLGERWKLPPKASKALALLPTSVPFACTLNNIVHIAVAHAKYYPWEECPLLYVEK